jgi:hypothetical protein
MKRIRSFFGPSRPACRGTLLPDPGFIAKLSAHAAGDLAAFRGTRRLRLDRDLYRQRVGRGHRPIFRVHAQELEAVDLVPRKDLERTIRELSHADAPRRGCAA